MATTNLVPTEQESPMRDSDQCVFVEGPKWGDCEFYGNWLLAAARGQALWLEGQDDPVFMKRVECFTFDLVLDFGIGAYLMIAELKSELTSFMIDLATQEMNYFVIFSGMGLFRYTGQSYLMTVPTSLDREQVRSALTRYADTIDSNYLLHPETLVTTVSYAEAKQCQRRRRALDIFVDVSDVAQLARA